MRTEQFSGYGGLNLVELPRPAASEERVLLRITAAGVTPLDHTILAGHFPLAAAPLILGNEGAGIVDNGGGTEFPFFSTPLFATPVPILGRALAVPSEWRRVASSGARMSFRTVFVRRVLPDL
jgi:hypothetical protein